uniref:G protein gamma domain-containing protein n=1 Tax=Ananas comosus var. bracteatus TaxID=296719 RepID=A0A6V7NNF6_ANACO|nr:unnamed protein product [Ananas comosus var. bracteatus]
MPENEAGAATSADDGAVAAAAAPPPPPGKHQISAELKRLEQEARFLEKELEEVEKTEKVSAALQEFLFKVESKPDPLLPVTNGPVHPSWDRWFEGPQDMRRCKCWIM